MNFGKYVKPSLIALSGLILFFAGCSVLFLTELYVSISSLSVGLFTIVLSYKNKNVLGGLFLGMYTTASFLLGLFLMTIIIEVNIFFSTGIVGEVPGFSLILDILSRYGFGMVWMFLAYAITGLFFGLVGYIFDNTLPKIVESKQLYLYRDYWSNVLGLGKNFKGDYPYLDRKFSLRRLFQENIEEAVAQKAMEPNPDLFFTQISKKDTSGLFRGNVTDLQSGQIIGKAVVNPYDLTSKYKPLVIKVAGLSRTPKGVRAPAFERLLSRFLNWFLTSWWFWLFYLSLSALFVLVVYLNHPSDWQIIIRMISISAVSLFFVWRWQITSKELFFRRPDERVLIFLVLVIFTLVFGVYYMSVNNLPTSPETWGAYWFDLIKWMLLYSCILGFGYMLIHRDYETVNTYFYKNLKGENESSKISSYRDPKDEPYWIKKENVKNYWVLRFMYFWKSELTLKTKKITRHSDWERIEVWIDAQTGNPKWVVSDYHYRELWYKVEGELPVLYTSFFLNFHTPIPVTNQKLAFSISKNFNKPTKDLLKTSITGKADELVEGLREFFEVFSESWKKLHPKEWVSNFGLSEKTAGFASGLPWTHWRYPKGVEEKENYVQENIARYEDQPQNK